MQKECPHCKKLFEVNIELPDTTGVNDALARYLVMAYEAIACPECMEWYSVREQAKRRFGCEYCQPHGAVWFNCKHMIPNMPACGLAVEAALARSYVGPKFAKYGNPPAGLVAKNPQHWKWMREVWPKTSGMHVICTGNRGTGKSSCMRWAMYGEVQKARTVMDLSAAFIQDELCAFGPEAAALRKRAKEVDVLLLDDFDRVELTSAALTVMRDVIDFRHEAERTMFVTCNYTKEELLKYMTGRHRAGDVHGAASLLERFNPNHTMPFVGTSWRPEMRAA